VFHSFIQYLQARPQYFHNIVFVPSAFVPVLKFHIGNFDIDLVICCVNCDTVNVDVPIREYSLIAKQEEDLRSLQGSIATEKILEYVREPTIFSRVLRAVKTWAMRRNIYSNQLGLLNGVGLAIMTAYICNTTPPPPPNTVVEYYYFTQFIRVFRSWNWDTTHVSLNMITNIPVKRNFMCVYTPLDPPLNCNFNTGFHQFRMIMSEFEHAYSSNFMVTPTFPSYFQSDECKYVLLSILSEKEEMNMFKLFIETKLKLLSNVVPSSSTLTFCTKCWRLSSNHVMYVCKIKDLDTFSGIQMLMTKLQTESSVRNGRINVDIVDKSLLPPFLYQ
jgi:hypothetical protein